MAKEMSGYNYMTTSNKKGRKPIKRTAIEICVHDIHSVIWYNVLRKIHHLQTHSMIYT